MFVGAALDNLVLRCGIHLEVIVTFWVRVDGQVRILPELFDLICPDDCNGRGSCDKGEGEGEILARQSLCVISLAQLFLLRLENL